MLHFFKVIKYIPLIVFYIQHNQCSFCRLNVQLYLYNVRLDFCLAVTGRYKYVFSENGLVAHKDGSLLHRGVRMSLID